jgi:hypothetical protein
VSHAEGGGAVSEVNALHSQPALALSLEANEVMIVLRGRQRWQRRCVLSGQWAEKAGRRGGGVRGGVAGA